MKRDLLIFDLDGTLVDSSQDIAVAANRTLETLGYNPLDIDTVKESIGWGVKMLLEGLMPDEPDERIDEARRVFLNYYGERLTEHTVTYPGVMEAMEEFTRRGKTMAIVTNKPVGLAVRLLDELDMSRFFSMVLGGDSLKNKKPHPEPIEKVLSELSTAPAASVYVGDSPVDCQAGRGAGVYTIGVTYGFRSRGELEEACFDVLIDDFSSLGELID